MAATSRVLILKIFTRLSSLPRAAVDALRRRLRGVYDEPVTPRRGLGRPTRRRTRRQEERRAVRRLTAEGPVAVGTAWERDAEIARWRTWSPQILRVEADAERI